MNQLLKYLGVFMILIAVVILGLYMYENAVSNTLLIVSGLLLIGGLAVYVILNKITE